MIRYQHSKSYNTSKKRGVTLFLTPVYIPPTASLIIFPLYTRGQKYVPAQKLEIFVGLFGIGLRSCLETKVSLFTFEPIDAAC